MPFLKYGKCQKLQDCTLVVSVPVWLSSTKIVMFVQNVNFTILPISVSVSIDFCINGHIGGKAGESMQLTKAQAGKIEQKRRKIWKMKRGMTNDGWLLTSTGWHPHLLSDPL